MDRTELAQRLWAAAAIARDVQILMRRQGEPQVDAALRQLRDQYAGTIGTLVPEQLRTADDIAALAAEVESGRAYDVPSAIASIRARHQAQLDAESAERVARIHRDAQHRTALALEATMMADGRRTRRALRTPWRKYH